MRAFHFISGLPRSGSTLLSAILKQNPNFHASMSSPVAHLFEHLINGMGARNEYSVFVDDEKRREILRSLFDAYYRQNPPDQTIFDTNRIWCAKLRALSCVFPEARVIACVRDPAWVLDSIERLLGKSPLLMSKLFPTQASGTVFSRVEYLASPKGMVGFSFNALQDAFFGDRADRLIVIDYEALARNPKRAIDFIYTTLGLPHFAHDFENINFNDGEQFDAYLGAPGLHSVGNKVSYTERPTVLPPEIFNRNTVRCFWKNALINRWKVPVLLP